MFLKSYLNIIFFFYQSQANTIHKPKNVVTYTEKNINQGKARTNIQAVGSPNQEPSFVNSNSEMKVNTETMSNKAMSYNMKSEIVKVSICKNESNMIGVGRGTGKLLHELTGSKKARTTSGPMPTQSNSERTSYSQVARQESSEANCVQNVPFRPSYNEIAKKKVNNTRKSDSSGNH